MVLNLEMGGIKNDLSELKSPEVFGNKVGNGWLALPKSPFLFQYGPIVKKKILINFAKSTRFRVV